MSAPQPCALVLGLTAPFPGKAFTDGLASCWAFCSVSRGEDGLVESSVSFSCVLFSYIGSQAGYLGSKWASLVLASSTGDGGRIGRGASPLGRPHCSRVWGFSVFFKPRPNSGDPLPSTNIFAYKPARRASQYINSLYRVRHDGIFYSILLCFFRKS